MSISCKIYCKSDSDVEEGEDSKSDDDVDSKELRAAHDQEKPRKCRLACCICKAMRRFVMEMLAGMFVGVLFGCLLVGIGEFARTLSGHSAVEQAIELLTPPGAEHGSTATEALAYKSGDLVYIQTGGGVDQEAVWTQNPEQKDTDGGRWVLREGANWKSLFDSDDINTDTAPSYEEERMKYLRAKKAATGTAQAGQKEDELAEAGMLPGDAIGLIDGFPPISDSEMSPGNPEIPANPAENGVESYHLYTTTTKYSASPQHEMAAAEYESALHNLGTVRTRTTKEQVIYSVWVATPEVKVFGVTIFPEGAVATYPFCWNECYLPGYPRPSGPQLPAPVQEKAAQGPITSLDQLARSVARQHAETGHAVSMTSVVGRLGA